MRADEGQEETYYNLYPEVRKSPPLQAEAPDSSYWKLPNTKLTEKKDNISRSITLIKMCICCE